jgi:CRP-like cAMP-binding protein
MSDLAVTAFWFGILSAVSLPLGTITASLWRPGDRMISFLMAFGGGALLSALTIDLVAEALRQDEFEPLAVGCILGGVLFVILNQAINQKGGFLRKASTTIQHLRKTKMRRFRQLSVRLSKVPLLHRLPPEEVQALIPYVTSRIYRAGTTIIRQGEPGDSLFIIEKGAVDIVDVKNQMQKIASISDGGIIGEIALLTGEPRSATVVAATDVRVWIVLKEHFDLVIAHSPKLAEAVRKLADERIADLKKQHSISHEDAERWAMHASRYIDVKCGIPNEVEIREAAHGHSSAPLAIWLGILLDGIPESLVIGSSLIHAQVSFSLIAGLFLSNYPEALSSSAGMKQQGYAWWKIFVLWFSLMVITGIGAYLGNLFFQDAPIFLFALIQGMAAGAMLTMIAETMLPEAYFKGGAITGFSTLLGFLSAIFFKTLE